MDFQVKLQVRSASGFVYTAEGICMVWNNGPLASRVHREIFHFTLHEHDKEIQRGVKISLPPVFRYSAQCPDSLRSKLWNHKTTMTLQVFREKNFNRRFHPEIVWRLTTVQVSPQSCRDSLYRIQKRSTENNDVFRRLYSLSLLQIAMCLLRFFRHDLSSSADVICRRRGA